MKSQRIGAAAPPWSWTIAVWTMIATFDATQNVLVMHSEGMHHRWVSLFANLLLAWLPWMAATPLVFYLGAKFPPTRLRPLRTWLVHAAACAAIGLTTAAWSTLLEISLDPWPAASRPHFFHLWIDKYYNGVLSTILLYAFVLCAQSTLESSKRIARQQAESARLNELLSKAQLSALRQQIEPHFLFNTLNAIAGLVRENRNDDAVNMIVGLSDFLRRVVEDSDRQKVPLAEELEFLRKYVDIQKVRFSDRLQVSVDVSPDALPAQIPALILQPMVENAIKHGIAKRVHGGTIRVSASRSNGTLNLNVYNDGPALSEGEQARPGIGISNVRTRLQGLYGNAFELTMRNRPGGVEVAVSLPYSES